MTRPSTRPGMGAVPYPGGVTFRVWAKLARSVAVMGTFNGWSRSEHPLAPDGSGYWSVDVPTASPGSEYKYVIVGPAGNRLEHADPYARVMTNSNGNSVVYDPTFDWGNTPFTMPAWDELVVYQLHVGSFNDDAAAAPPGTIGSVISRLDHLVGLGVNAILLLPPAEFPGGLSWGYNSSSIFTVETDYGGPTALKTLIRAAHERGIAVLCDVVYNHFGTGDNIVYRYDGWHDERHDGGIYIYDNDRRATGYGDRPDYGRPEVRQYLRDNARAWLHEFRFDGLRWDATSLISSVRGDGGWPLPDGQALMRWINSEIDDEQPWKISMAEDMKNDPWITRPAAQGGAGFDTQWDAGFVHPVRHVLTRLDDAHRNMGDVRAALQHRYDDRWLARVVYTESHDEVARNNGNTRLPAAIDRVNAHSWYAKKRSTLAAVLVFTAPGIPMIFQGQEFLEYRAWNEDVPLDWADAGRHAGIVNLYRDLIALRRNTRYTTRGLRGPHLNVFHVNDDGKVIAYHRWAGGGPGDDVVVLANFSRLSFPAYRIGLPRPGSWRVRLNTDWDGYDRSFGGQPVLDTGTDQRAQDGMSQSAVLGLPAYTAIVLSQDG